jgi:release factor glutamine methyltransferase
MTLNQTLLKTAQLLDHHNIEDSFFEARILLGHLLKLSPEELLTKTEYRLAPEQEEGLHELIQKRLKREPAAYIIARKEFYGIDFMVDQRVLIPRPETELLVEEALTYFKTQPSNNLYNKKKSIIADVGTGCGAIAISLSVNQPDIHCYATDISSDALEVARYNAKFHDVVNQITFLQGNLLEPLPEPVDLILANLPYIKHSEISNLSPEIKNYEPQNALDGGAHGLLYIKQLIEQSKGKLHNNGCLILEIGYDQAQQIENFIRRSFIGSYYEFVSDPGKIKRLIKIFP